MLGAREIFQERCGWFINGKVEVVLDPMTNSCELLIVSNSQTIDDDGVRSVMFEAFALVKKIREERGERYVHLRCMWLFVDRQV